ncbi:MAG: peptidylprolyl isomerase [Magnetococcales bacterium]|nr:peptidylprolyl isomerase [Magnetococcales bacterium]
MKLTDVLTQVQGKPITVADTMDQLKVTGAFRNAIFQLIEQEVVRIKAKEYSIPVKRREMEKLLEERRRMAGLSDPRTVSAFCRQNGITWDQWKEQVTTDYLRQKLKERIAGPTEVETYFEHHREELKRVCLARIVCQNREQADALKARIDAGSGFSKMARKHSLEPTSRIAGGYLGCFQRGTLPATVDHAVFSADLNAVVGPLQQKDHWVLYRVSEIIHAELNDGLKRQIAERIFNLWFRNEVLNVRP